MHSKLYLSVDIDGEVMVRFYSNFDRRDRTGINYEEAERAGEAFVKDATEYLAKLS